MENIDFDWLDGNCALNYGTLEFSASGSPRAGTAAKQASPVAQRASLAAERADPTQMRATFRLVRFGLMVGIGGGIPSTEADI
jgi:hypothetical protein